MIGYAILLWEFAMDFAIWDFDIWDFTDWRLLYEHGLWTMFWPRFHVLVIDNDNVGV